jgi:hypothetical protein
VVVEEGAYDPPIMSVIGSGVQVGFDIVGVRLVKTTDLKTTQNAHSTYAAQFVDVLTKNAQTA